MLAPEERMLMFFNGKDKLSNFMSESGCTAYHNDLFEPENTVEDNIQWWDLGDTKMMACTTGFTQGIDQPHVRFMVMKNPNYGLLLTTQMMGWTGRDGERSHAIVVNMETGQSFRGDLCSHSVVTAILGNDKDFWVFSSTKALDRANRAYKCTDCPRRVACDVCNPSDLVHYAIITVSKSESKPIVPLTPPPQLMKTDAHFHWHSAVQVRFTHLGIWVQYCWLETSNSSLTLLKRCCMQCHLSVYRSIQELSRWALFLGQQLFVLQAGVDFTNCSRTPHQHTHSTVMTCISHQCSIQQCAGIWLRRKVPTLLT